MKTELPNYFEETDLATSEHVVQVDENLVPLIDKMWLRDGVNLIHTDPVGLQITAQVSGGEITGYFACNAQRNSLIVAIEQQTVSVTQPSQNTCHVILIDLHGKVLRTYLMPSPKHVP
jgi:hypothetical protein